MIAEILLLVLVATVEPAQSEPTALDQAEKAAADCDELVDDLKAADAAMRKLLRAHAVTTTDVGHKTANVKKSADDLAGPERAGMSLLGVLGVVAGVVGGGAAVAKTTSVVVSAVKKSKAMASQLAAFTGTADDDPQPPPPIPKRPPTKAPPASNGNGNGHASNRIEDRL